MNTPPMPGGKPGTKPQKADRFGQIPTGEGKRIVLYGTGGIGKTTLAVAAPGPVAMIDLDESLGELREKIAMHDIRYMAGLHTYDSVLTALREPGWDEIKTIVLDSVTRFEELCVEWVLDHVSAGGGSKASDIEAYGYGKGYVHVYDAFIKLLAELDRHVRAGRNVITVCHDCTVTVPNPTGEDYVRYEPRLQSRKDGQNSIRLKLKEWAGHLLFIGYDLAVKDKKASGSGTRTIWPTEQPHCMAKSRTLANSIEYIQGDGELWKQMFNKEVTS